MILHVLQAFQRLERASDKKTGRGGEKLPASITLKIGPETFAFCHRAGADEGSQTWSHFQAKALFSEFRIESKRQNKIDLEAPIANLLHVFNSCHTSERTTIRLANGKDGRPVLGFEFMLGGQRADHKVDQEVPVRVIPEAEADRVVEPVLPEPDMQLEFPRSLNKIRGVFEKMQKVGASYVELEAGRQAAPALGGQPAGFAALAPAASASGGQLAYLKLIADSELVSIASTFPSLPVVQEGKTRQAPEKPVRLHLLLKRLLEVLTAFQFVNAEAHIACVLEQQALVLYALLPHKLGSLISYTPALAT
eukprot:TRINITY_DN92504_c0_g1_i1.p1 TRINITY_DN92504_c0_g1~~TRINITY_DN92504_c0_g1_i1.p1  ORF type:complete len:357 (-),score=96.25 TRINITY_DN92504_c0_g1_i1:161-1084(-)